MGSLCSSTGAASDAEEEDGGGSGQKKNVGDGGDKAAAGEGGKGKKRPCGVHCTPSSGAAAVAFPKGSPREWQAVGVGGKEGLSWGGGGCWDAIALLFWGLEDLWARTAESKEEVEKDDEDNEEEEEGVVQ